MDNILTFTKNIIISDTPQGGKMFSRNRNTFAQQTTDRQAWFFTVNYETIAMGYRENRAFVEELRGINKYNPFSFSLANAPARLQYQFGYLGNDPTRINNITVVGPGGSPRQLIVSGFTPSTSGVLMANDYIQVGNGVRTVTANVNSGADGRATIPLSGALVSTPSPGTPVVIGGDRVVWNNCFYTDDGYPELGVDSMVSKPGIMTSTSGTFTFYQERS